MFIVTEYAALRLKFQKFRNFKILIFHPCVYHIHLYFLPSVLSTLLAGYRYSVWITDLIIFEKYYQSYGPCLRNSITFMEKHMVAGTTLRQTLFIVEDNLSRDISGPEYEWAMKMGQWPCPIQLQAKIKILMGHLKF